MQFFWTRYSVNANRRNENWPVKLDENKVFPAVSILFHSGNGKIIKNHQVADITEKNNILAELQAAKKNAEEVAK